MAKQDERPGYIIHGKTVYIEGNSTPELECTLAFAQAEDVYSMDIFWQRIITEKQQGYPYIVVNGSCYQSEPDDKTSAGTLGYGGATWFFHLLEYPEYIFRTCNLWHRGEIPERFRVYLPDNCEQMKSPVEDHTTTPLFWECVCDKDAIHPHHQLWCKKCGTHREGSDVPDAHKSDVTRELYYEQRIACLKKLSLWGDKYDGK